MSGTGKNARLGVFIYHGWPLGRLLATPRISQLSAEAL